MKRHVRRFSRRIRRKFSEVQSMASNLVRSNSSYHYPQRSITSTTTTSPPVSDTDDDPVFEPTTDNISSTNDAHRPSVILLPCEFCHIQQSGENLDRHQRACQQNPEYPRRRRPLVPNNTSTERRRRAVSDYGPSAPSAPPRSRSPSPTEGFPIPGDLLCPIMHSLFIDPVVASDGHTYERSAIINCLRTSKLSPMTREPISADKLNPNRVIKKMADDFRAECQRKRSLYKYKLDVDVKKLEEISYLKTNTKTIYQAEWIKNNSSSTNSKIILLHLIGENAEKIAEINCKLELHPNIVRTLGRVEHNDTGILLLQEYLPKETLSQLIKHTDQKLSIKILDTIIYQIASALQHLASLEIIHGNVTSDNVFIYQFDEIPENILVKLTNIGDLEISNNGTGIDKIAPELLSSKNHYSEKSDVYAFGILARKLYSLELATNDEDLIERQTLFEHCLATDPNERPTFNELTKTVTDLIPRKKFIFPALTE